jgi:hypothetical protein
VAEEERNEYWRAAFIAASVFNSQPRKRGAKALNPEDLIPSVARRGRVPKPKPTPEQEFAAVAAYFSARANSKNN